MKLYNTVTDQTFTLADIKKMVIPPFSLSHVLWVILQASVQKENDIRVIGLTDSELKRVTLRLYDRNNAYYTAHIDWRS